MVVPMYRANWFLRTYSVKNSESQMRGVSPGLAGVTFMSANGVAPVAWIEGT